MTSEQQPEASIPSKKTNWLNRRAALMSSTSNVSIILLSIGICVLALAWSVRIIVNLKEESRNRSIARQREEELARIREKVDTLWTSTVNASVSVLLKYSPSGHVQYQTEFIPDYGYEFGSTLFGKGHLTLQLLDSDGFLIHREVLGELTRVLDNDGNCVAMKHLGSIPMTLDEFARVRHLGAPHSIPLKHAETLNKTLNVRRKDAFDFRGIFDDDSTK